MQELSLNILDIAQNSIRAEAALVEIAIQKDPAEDRMVITIKDDGCGMTPEHAAAVENPFFTTRTTRPVGLGVPLFKMSAELTGGSFHIDSMVGNGTTVTAEYHLGHIDLMPIGDMTSTMLSLIGMNTHIDFTYTYRVGPYSFCLDTREVREILEGLPLDAPDVMAWMKEYLEENTAQIDAGNPVEN